MKLGDCVRIKNDDKFNFGFGFIIEEDKRMVRVYWVPEPDPNETWPPTSEWVMKINLEVVSENKQK